VTRLATPAVGARLRRQRLPRPPRTGRARCGLSRRASTPGGVSLAGVKILVVGAGQVGATVVDALHDEHELTVVDLDENRLAAMSNRYDAATVLGNGASRRTLQEAGLLDSDLLIACTSKDEINLIAAIFSRNLAPDTRTIVRTTNEEYLEVWRERQLDVDFMVSSELETANAVSTIIGLPAARQTDVFADGQVQIVEFDVEPGNEQDGVVGVPLREARIPHDSKVAGIIRGDRMIIPRGDQTITVGDRVVIIASPDAARTWADLVSKQERRLDDVVIFGAGQTGNAIARALVDQSIRVRMIEADVNRARDAAARFPTVRVYNATGLDPEFLERERIGQSRAAVFAMRDDAKNHYAATLAKLHGVGFTIAIVHDAVSIEVFERAGIDSAINPRQVTAEEIVRFAHDPRTRQVAMLEGDRFEILDITVRAESEYANQPFRTMPIRGALIGAIVRDGQAIFPHGDDVLRPGDRAIIFTESASATRVERAL
jgi:trk system potassium uptake protein TrkA